MDASKQLNLARQRMQAGDFAGAEATLRGVAQSHPANADATYMLGLAILNQNRPPEAVEFLTRAATMLPNVPEVHANLAHALRLLGRVDDAAAALERALTLRPNYPLALNSLGAVRRAQGRTADSLACYRKAVSLQPNLLPAHLNLGNALLESGRAIPDL